MDKPIPLNLKTSEMPLRDYQQTCVDKTLEYYRSGGTAGILVVPTGGGKTRIETAIARTLLEEECTSRRRTEVRPIVMCAHRDSLVTQMVSAVGRDIPGISCGIEMSGMVATGRNLVIVASIPTIGRAGSHRMAFVERVGTSQFFIDEVHHAAADGYIRAAEKYSHEGGLKLGVTATNHRLDKKQIVKSDGTALFDTVIHQISLLDGMRGKWLCPIRAYRVVSSTDISQVGTVAGDFNQKALEKAIDNETRTREAISKWKEVAHDRRTLVFCVSIKHAENAAAMWRKAGFKFEVVHSQQSKELNELYLNRFMRGEVQGICNVGVLTEGWDGPYVNCIVQLRPTQSWVLYCQTIGRGTRNAPGKKDCIVLDVVDNTVAHNIVTAPQVVDLPAGLDLEGASLEDAVEEIEKAKKSRKRVEKAKTLHEVKTSVVEIDLFNETVLSNDVSRLSKITWIKTAGGYIVHVGTDRNGRTESVEVYRDILGVWRMKRNNGFGVSRFPNNFGETDIPPWGRIDNAVQYLYQAEPDKLRMIMKGASKDGPASMHQQRFLLERGGIPYNQSGIMTEKQAQIMIQKVYDGFRIKK